MHLVSSKDHLKHTSGSDGCARTPPLLVRSCSFIMLLMSGLQSTECCDSWLCVLFVYCTVLVFHILCCIIHLNREEKVTNTKRFSSKNLKKILLKHSLEVSFFRTIFSIKIRKKFFILRIFFSRSESSWTRRFRKV